MTSSPQTQARYTHGRWQAGRLRFPSTGDDPTDTWVVDVIVVEEDMDEDLRAIARYRPQRGMTPHLGPVIDRAIRAPVDGRPHLPAVVRVATAELAEEIRSHRPEVTVRIGPTPLVDELGLDFAADIVPEEDDRWTWLAAGASPAQVTRLFEAFAAFHRTLAWESLSPLQLVRVQIPSLGLAPAWVNVLASDNLTGGLVLTIAIAPDRASLDAWLEDECSPTEITIFGAEADDLPREAWAERKAHGWEPFEGYYPRVTAGGDEERPADATELAIAAAVLEAMALHCDPVRAGADDGDFTLTDGAAARVTVDEDEVLPELDDDEDLDEEDLDEDEFIVPGDDDDEDRQFLALDRQKTWSPAPPPADATVRSAPKPGRNDPCPCGSGKKYKKCCG